MYFDIILEYLKIENEEFYLNFNLIQIILSEAFSYRPTFFSNKKDYLSVKE